MPQTIVSQREYNFKISEAVKRFIVWVGHRFLDAQYYDTGCWSRVTCCLLIVTGSWRLSIYNK